MALFVRSRRALLCGATALAATALLPARAYAAQDDATDVTVSNDRVVTYSGAPPQFARPSSSATDKAASRKTTKR